MISPTVPTSPNQNSRFSQGQRQLMLELARKSISCHLDGLEFSVPDLDFLKQPSGAFVTLRKRGMLRGCIGSIEAMFPLGETISKCSISSATQDPRFPPLRKSELDSIQLEISVISPMRTTEVKEIIVGTHGVMIEYMNQHGLLLPQVPLEHDWDRDTFLNHVCLKAGLSPDVWKSPGPTFWTFTAEIFSE
jgi:AmmeMemoRadiSam system protein A